MSGCFGVWTYFATSTSSSEAALFPAPQDDSRKLLALGASITSASDMVVDSHTVTEREQWRGSLVLFDKNIHNKDAVREGEN